MLAGAPRGSQGVAFVALSLGSLQNLDSNF